ncbi:uncharacterized protein I206_102519 [Kwoniella pini CBS 10737]|uniref:Uncharacterized protein n=1 Tax=Kwoniella pini CBS 10737 TaxID=1296096 RepID=A0A1B9I5L5_9TREE|nr:uncharacterized protein I206_02870 [Kwoniella pini CBS 10737]OCF50813.1 hypothetical protein I206_02870 [Kwoniella pini CBS 10737]
MFKNGNSYNCDNPRHFASNQNANVQSSKIIDPSLILPKSLLGGEEIIKSLHFYSPLIKLSLSLSEKEEIQKKLWEGWNLNYNEALKKSKECQMQIILSFQAELEDFKLFKKHRLRSIKFQEEYVKCEFIKMIIFIEITLKQMNEVKLKESKTNSNSNSNSIIEDLIKKKNDNSNFKSIKECIDKAEEWKEKGNQMGKSGNYSLAIHYYLLGLISIWPWTSSSTLMSFEESQNTGLVRIEQALLNNIVTISISYPASKSSFRKFTFDNIARITCDVILEIRYITINNLRKAYERLALLDEREYGEKGKQGVNSLMAELLKDKEGTDWAHRHCIEQHVCHE